MAGFVHDEIDYAADQGEDVAGWHEGEEDEKDKGPEQVIHQHHHTRPPVVGPHKETAFGAKQTTSPQHLLLLASQRHRPSQVMVLRFPEFTSLSCVGAYSTPDGQERVFGLDRQQRVHTWDLETGEVVGAAGRGRQALDPMNQGGDVTCRYYASPEGRNLLSLVHKPDGHVSHPHGICSAKRRELGIL
jgi:hypothetical protein